MFKDELKWDDKTYSIEEVKGAYGHTALKVRNEDGVEIKAPPLHKSRIELEQLEVGDKVLVTKHWLSKPNVMAIEEVTRSIKTQFAAGGIRFYKRTGYDVGSSRSSRVYQSAVPYNEETVILYAARKRYTDHKENKRNERRDLLTTVEGALRDASTDTLQTIASLLLGSPGDNPFE